jgi:amino-acid N-acetyltransferase
LHDAGPDDIGGLVALIEPLEADGTLVRRSRELLEREITRFSVVEHDGVIVGCAALYPYGEEQAELACLAVHPHYRRWGYGALLMKRIEAQGAWPVSIVCLSSPRRPRSGSRNVVSPSARLMSCRPRKRLVYNLQRRSSVLMKEL